MATALVVSLPLAAVAVPGTTASGQALVFEEVGLARLFERLAPGDRPTGTGVVVAQVEAGDAGYVPDAGLPALRSKAFHRMSGSSRSLGHASTVAKAFYGKGRSLAPGIREVYLYDASGWTGGDFLRATAPASVPALQPPAGLKIVNNSWVGAFGDASLDATLLRRADAVVLRDDLIIVNGVNNGEPNRPLLSHMFNGIAVGRSDGLHQPHPTLLDHDGPSRTKPEIVAPGAYTSFAVPVVSAAAALLVETARNDTHLTANPDAVRSDVIKAALLAGAHHRPTWSNFPETEGSMRGVTTTPLDPVVGVDVLDIDASHRILTAGSQPGTFNIRSRRRVPNSGWSRPVLWSGESLYYRLRIERPAVELSVVATWHRDVSADLASWAMADADLYLWRVDRRNRLAPLVGDEGLASFDSGNVTSESPLDNVEHLHVRGLRPGEYVLELRRQAGDGLEGPWPIALAWRLPEDAGPAPADLNGDRAIDSIDLVDVIMAWGICQECEEDLTGDGRVDAEDMVVVVTSFTPKR
ncbi:MAG: hypothetical protein ACYTF9_00030 [Planctomycetota bacterium]|jgi:hypothetical protein